MSLLRAILLMIGLAMGSYVVGGLIGVPALPGVMVVASAVWVLIDARRLRLQRYRTGLTSPAVATVGVLALWFLFFPWYLVTRHRILAGEIHPRYLEDPGLYH